MFERAHPPTIANPSSAHCSRRFLQSHLIGAATGDAARTGRSREAAAHYTAAARTTLARTAQRITPRAEGQRVPPLHCTHAVREPEFRNLTRCDAHLDRHGNALQISRPLLVSGSPLVLTGAAPAAACLAVAAAFRYRAVSLV